MRKRLRCLWLLARLPGRSMDEAEEVLRDMKEFYGASRPATPPPQPCPSFLATMGETVISPPFSIEPGEDDLVTRLASIQSSRVLKSIFDEADAMRERDRSRP